MNLKILNQSFAVNYLDKPDRGSCSPSQGAIEISSRYSEECQEITLLHEIFHAILDMGGFFDLAKNEPLVCHLSNCLYSLKKENIELFK